jgi:hypothetical protein
MGWAGYGMGWIWDGGRGWRRCEGVDVYVRQRGMKSSSNDCVISSMPQYVPFLIILTWRQPSQRA